MSDFSAYLRNISTRLPIPEPARSRILLEIATDMEDLLQHYLDSGADRWEAMRSVEEQFELPDEALRELVQIHSSSLGGSLERLSGQARSSWERWVLALVAAFVILGLTRFLLQPALFADASPLAYALVGILALGLGVAVWKALTLFGAGSRRQGSAPRRGLGALPGLALLLLGLGFAGIWVELYRVALATRASPEGAFVGLVNWLHMASATLVVSLSGALLTGLLWFFLESRAAHLDERAASAMLGPPV